MELNGVTGKTLFARGKRGIIYSAYLGKERVAIKVKRPDSQAVGAIENEAKWLKILNQKKIGPMLLESRDDYLIMEFVDGDFIEYYVKKNSKENVKKILLDVLEQMFLLDAMQINKEEMNHPHKHIIIRKDKAFLIDFERARKTLKPKNVTQFCTFISHWSLLKEKGFSIDEKKIMDASRVYKSDICRKNLKNISELF